MKGIKLKSSQGINDRQEHLQRSNMKTYQKISLKIACAQDSHYVNQLKRIFFKKNKTE